MYKERKDRKTEVALRHKGEKSGGSEEDILPVGVNSEEVADLEKHHKMF